MSLDTEQPAATAPETTTPAATPARAQDAAPSKPQSEDEALSAIYREAMAADDSKPAPEQAAADDQEPKTDEAKGTPQRDPATGKFLAKATALDGDTPQASATEAEKDDASKEPEAKTQEAPSEGHFRGWDKAKREAFQKLPKEAQEFVLAHQKELQSAASRKETELTNYARSLSPYAKVLGEEKTYLERVSRDIKVPPHEVVRNLMKTEATLRYGTYAEKTALLQEMAADYGIPVSVLKPEQAGAQGGSNVEQTALVHDLKQEIASLKAQIAEVSQTREQLQNEQTQTVVERFKSATGPDGKLLHPFFKEVAPLMGQLMRTGEADTLEDAYRIATEPMRKAIEEEAAARLRRERADSAQKAGRINVVTQPAPLNRFDNEDEALSYAYRSAMAS